MNFKLHIQSRDLFSLNVQFLLCNRKVPLLHDKAFRTLYLYILYHRKQFLQQI